MAHIHFRNGFFLGIGEFHEKELWKAAGFRFSKVRKAWVTDRLDVAQKVQGVPWTRTALAEVETRAQVAEASHTLSFAKETDYQVPVPAGIHPLTGKPFEFFPYQRAGVEFAMMRKDTLVGDAPGLGKSPMGVGVYNADLPARRCLVICPASLKEHWRREFVLWNTKGATVGIAETRLDVRARVGVFKTGKNIGKPRYKIVETIPEVWPDTEVVIINYDILERFAAQINAIVWDIVICDEAHALKSDESGRTLFVLGGSRREIEYDADDKPIMNPNGKPKKKMVWYKAIEANRRVFLTGTPMMNRPIELWPMLRTCDPAGLGKDRNAYGYRYCAGFWDARIGANGASNFSGASHLEELGTKLRHSFMVRRLKKDVLPELPSKFRQMVVLDSPEIRELVARESEVAQALKLYESMICRQGESEYDRDCRIAAEIEGNAARLGFGDADDPDQPNARLLNMDFAKAVTGLEPPMVSVLFEEIAQIRRELGIAKLSAVVPWVKNFLDGGEKLIVFAYHTAVVLALNDALKAYKPAMIYGGVQPRKRQPIVDMFQNDEDCRVGVMQIDAAGVGYTMTRAKDVAFAEQDWVPTKMDQAFDRICRIGQKANKLMGFNLVADGSLDAKMAQRAYEKELDIMATMDSGIG